MTSTTGQGAKRALLIGIDKYPALRPLDGCVNDVELMAGTVDGKFDMSLPPAAIRFSQEESDTTQQSETSHFWEGH